MTRVNTFQFLDPGALVDRELTLVAPHERYIDALVEACAHPLTCKLQPDVAMIDRVSVRRMLRSCPQGHQMPDPELGLVPSYHFWMYLPEDDTVPAGVRLPGAAGGSIVGGVSLRIGNTSEIEMYYGHFGYHVYPPWRGHHYAERAVRLLLPLAQQHQLHTIWITCNPDNLSSRRTCERLGGELIETVRVPWGHPLWRRGERTKCRFRYEI